MTTPLNEIDEPWLWQATDYRGKIITIKVNWDSATGELLNAITFRDPECVYTNIFIGIPADGIPNNTPDQWEVPEGEHLIRGFALKKASLVTIHDILARQITAG